jgi:hypothetical protein
MYAHPQNLAADSISHGSRMLVGPSCRLQQRQRLVAPTSRRPLRHMRIAVHADLPNIVVHSPRSRKKKSNGMGAHAVTTRDRPSPSQRDVYSSHCNGNPSHRRRASGAPLRPCSPASPASRALALHPTPPSLSFLTELAAARRRLLLAPPPPSPAAPPTGCPAPAGRPSRPPPAEPSPPLGRHYPRPPPLRPAAMEPPQP